MNKKSGNSINLNWIAQSSNKLAFKLSQIGDAVESDATGATPVDFVSRDIFL